MAALVETTVVGKLGDPLPPNHVSDRALEGLCAARLCSSVTVVRLAWALQLPFTSVVCVIKTGALGIALKWFASLPEYIRQGVRSARFYQGQAGASKVFFTACD
jgi:hypothetical protein